MKWKLANKRNSRLNASEQQRWEAVSVSKSQLVTSKVLRTVSNSVSWFELGGGGGWGVWEQATVTSMSARCFTWLRVRWRGIIGRRARGQLCCWGPREKQPGGTLHTMPLHVCLLCQHCDPVSCPSGGWGREGVGGRAAMWQCPPLYWNSLLGHSQRGIIHAAWGAISLQRNPEWEIKPRAAQTSSVWPLAALFFHRSTDSAALAK